jgi:hypothetical protein
MQVMRTLHSKAMRAMSWVRPSGRRGARTNPVSVVVEPAPQVVATSNKEREATSYSLVGW